MIMAGTNTKTAEVQAATPDAADTETERVDAVATADTQESAGLPAGNEPSDAQSVARRRRISISISARDLLHAALIAILVGAVATLAWLYIGARHQVDAAAQRSQNDAHAEKVALDYAVNAATMDFKDLNAWKTKLVAGTSPELNDKLTKAGGSMEQILVPLQWSSTAQPIIGKVRSDTGGIYVVDCFVSVQTKTVQAPDPLQSTATYSLTIDSNKNWQITDVGGIGSVVKQK
jgi:Mce-associated membrane protein